MKTQAQHAVSAMLKGWQSTRSLIDASGSLTPLARLAEWRKDNEEVICIGKSELFASYTGVYRINGKDYEEITRTRKVLNRDSKVVQITERKFVKVK